MEISNYTTVRYLRPNSTKGARIKIQYYNGGWRAPIYLSYCYATGDVKKQAIQYLQEKKINLVRLITYKQYYIFVTE